MIRGGTTNCPDCGGGLKYYDRVKRILRTKGGNKTFLKVRRFKCVECNKIHRELPEFIFEYKHYEAEIINGVMEGYITSDSIDYEDYPSDMTMKRWRSRK